MAQHAPGVLTDCYGLPVTTRAHQALSWYDRGLRGLLGFRKETPDCFLKALEIDPAFNMAHCHLGVYYFLEESEEMVARARACFTQAQVDLDALTDRERDVVETLTAWGSGNVREAIPRMHAALEARPREVILLQRLYFIYFVQGAADKFCQLAAQSMPHYANDSYILGMYSFGLEETRDYARATEIGRQALALNREDAWALHALAHVYYETGAFTTGTQLLRDGLSYCDGIGTFRTHIVWHLALFLWEQGHSQQVVALYHEEFPAPTALLPPSFVDAVSLLWRLNLTGYPTPDEWETLTPYLDHLRTARTYLFNQMHVGLGLTGGQHLDWAQAYIEDVRARVRPERPGPLGEVGVPLLAGMIAYAKGDYAGTIEHLHPIRDHIVTIGGSHAQREIFVDVLLDACLRAQEYDLAVALLEGKRQRRPDRPLALFGLEQAYTGVGERAKATAVGTQDRALWRQMGADADMLARFTS